MVRYRQILPSAALRTFVAHFWLLEDDGASGVQRIVPDGHSELILNWGQPFESLQDASWQGQPRCFFAGQIDGPLLLRPRGPARMLGIGFHPHGAASVFAPPMHELSARFTPVEDLSAPLSRDLNRALDSPDPIAAVEAAMLSAAKLSRREDVLIREAVRRIVLARGAADLAALARQVGLSTRQFERRFQATVGLSPKLFCRIQRLQGVFHLLGDEPRNWVDTAVACGYYDQPHLIRDCKDLSGSTPTALLDSDADLARHFYEKFGVSHSSNTGASDSL